MSTKSQTILIVSATLVIGFVLGVLISGAFRHQREERFRRMGAHQRFENAMERIIKPTDEQRKAIEAITKKRFDRIAELREQCEDELFTVLDSMRGDFATVLTEEQLNRLEKQLEKGPQGVFREQMDRLADELDLTNEQKKQLREIMRAARPFRPLHGLQGPEGVQRPRRPPMRRIIREMQEKIEAVLTPEQITKYRQLKRFPPRHFGGAPFRPPFEKTPPSVDPK